MRDWKKIYRAYHEEGFWDDPNKAILMDKAPPNVAKIPALVDFFKENDHDYRVVAMYRHPCMTPHEVIEENLKNGKRLRFAKMLEDAEKAVDSGKFFKIEYENLITQPQKVVKDLVDWFPELHKLSIDHNFLDEKKSKHASQVKGPYKDGTDPNPMLMAFANENPVFSYQDRLIVPDSFDPSFAGDDIDPDTLTVTEPKVRAAGIAATHSSSKGQHTFRGRVRAQKQEREETLLRYIKSSCELEVYKKRYDIRDIPDWYHLSRYSDDKTADR